MSEMLEKANKMMAAQLQHLPQQAINAAAVQRNNWRKRFLRRRPPRRRSSVASYPDDGCGFVVPAFDLIIVPAFGACLTDNS